MDTQAVELFCEDENGNPTPVRCAYRAAADPNVAQMVIYAPVSDDGRSDFMWFRLANGDLVLGVYPRGNIYCLTEVDRNRP